LVLIALLMVSYTLKAQQTESQLSKNTPPKVVTATHQNQPSFVSQDCAACHQEQANSWHESDHARAMSLPTTEYVLGNFDNQKVSHFEQQAHFFKDGDVYKATIKDSDNDEGETFTIKYTFGYDPLQQYLVETERGKLHVLPFAWDARPIKDGGQRWYHLYEHEVSDKDRLHWRQPLQNWNGMCADCHSDELKRNYEPIADSFNTQFSGINVGCVSCHGNDANAWSESHPLPNQADVKKGPYKSIGDNYAAQAEKGYWRLEKGKNTVSWASTPRDNAFMDTCYACHSLRAPLSDGFKANTSFLDNFSPQLITPPIYHADGQIKEEVYVYGSFLQSKMYKNSVNCLDCHDPHTMKLKVEGNGLCLQCHTAQAFDTPKHHGHSSNSKGAQCVNCHMPDEIYMGVDARRDHSFKIPRPDLSDEFALPNACIGCHEDESNQWAANAIESWHGKPDALESTRNNLLKLRHGQRLSLQDHLMIAYDTNIDAISRASAIQMLAQSTNELLPTHLVAFVADKEDLIRLAAARVANLVPAQQRVKLLLPLLKDKRKAIRTEAATHLISLEIAQADIALFKTAFEELLEATATSSWRGEGRVNLANIWLQSAEPDKAENILQGANKYDPFFAPAYVNLADMYRAMAREDAVAQVLTRGIQNLPESADITYSYGLHKVRQNELARAVKLFAKSIELDPSNSIMAYTYVLAIDGLGQTDKALRELKALLPNYENQDQSLIELGLFLAQKARSRADYLWFQQKQRR
jgi:predicted CXXCH cytochrome family protein